MISEGPLGKVSYGRSLRSRRRDRVRDKGLEHPTLNVPAAVFMMYLYQFYGVSLKLCRDFQMFNLEIPWRAPKGAVSVATFSDVT